MSKSFRNVEEFRHALVAMAEELRWALIPMSRRERLLLVTRLVAESDMIFGVWPDPEESEGFGVEPIKGEGLMPPLEGFELPDAITIAAIPCVGLDQALAARKEWSGAANDVDTAERARVALSIAEVARQVWIASQGAEAGGKLERLIEGVKIA